MDSVYDKIKFLVTYLNKCTKAYDEGKPIISDAQWDEKYFELQELEKETGLILSNSPTQNISYEIVNALNKVEHSHKMLSLEKTKSIDEVISFAGKKDFLAMCKMDGLTCSLTYRNGELVSAETRGNGLVGEDILHNARVLPSIPHKIPYTDELVIDGEIICTYTDFEKFSSEYKNPRNFAAGSIRLLDSKECAGRNLTFVAWDVITAMYSDNGTEYKLSQKLSYLIPFGFTVVPYINNSIEVDKVSQMAKEKSYPIDGVVIKFDDCEYGRSLGETTHHFKNALAYKFYDETYESELINIDYEVSRNGEMVPVAIFKPVEIDGTVIQKCSLFNLSVLEEKLGQPYIGQVIWVCKKNMIIPYIEKAVKANCAEMYINIPEICPFCNAKTITKTSDGGIKTLWCSNDNCSSKLINRLDHFCGKKGLDIKGISKATLEKLIDWGWVSDFTDIFELSIHKDEWAQKPGFGVKSVDKILSAIDTGANCELHQFIAALGIPLIGSTASKELAKYFKTWEEFIQAVESGFAFYTLPNFGGEMHNSIVNFEYAEARLLANHYIHFNAFEVAPATTGESLIGKTFVITGKLSYFKNRDEIKTRIEALGGKVTGSVSKNTDFLINNDINSASSKNQTAKSLGIPILSEEDFIQTFGIE